MLSHDSPRATVISGAMAIRTIRSVRELEEVRTCWEGWQKHPNSHLDYFQLICRLRQEAVKPYVIVVESDGQPRALLVGRLERTRFVPSIGYLKAVGIPARVLTLLYNGCLGDVDEAVGEELVRNIWSVLTSGEADAVVFHELPEGSPLLKALLVSGPRWWCEKRPSWSSHWEMDLQEEMDFLKQKVGSKQRWKIRKRQRDLESAFPGQVSWRWMRHFDDVAHICARLEDVAARTYHRGLGAGFINDEEHRSRFALLAERGQLRVQPLEICGKVRAFWVGTVYRGIFYSSATGYDPDLRGYEPGTLVFVRMVEELAREGVRKLDFGLGDAVYKQRFGDRSSREATIRVFGPTGKGLVLRFSQGFSNIMDATGRHLLQRLGALDRLKTLWRRRLTVSGAGAEEDWRGGCLAGAHIVI